MRTFIGSRYSIDRGAEYQDLSYVHLRQRPSESRSCFYDFG